MMAELQSFAAKGVRKSKDGPRRLNADELDRVWDEVQAQRRDGLGWVPMITPEPISCQSGPSRNGSIF